MLKYFRDRSVLVFPVSFLACAGEHNLQSSPVVSNSVVQAGAPPVAASSNLSAQASNANPVAGSNDDGSQHGILHAGRAARLDRQDHPGLESVNQPLLLANHAHWSDEEVRAAKQEKQRGRLMERALRHIMGGEPSRGLPPTSLPKGSLVVVSSQAEHYLGGADRVCGSLGGVLANSVQVASVVSDLRGAGEDLQEGEELVCVIDRAAESLSNQSFFDDSDSWSCSSNWPLLAVGAGAVGVLAYCGIKYLSR